MIHQFHKYELITVLFMLKLVPESETILTTIVIVINLFLVNLAEALQPRKANM